MKIEFKNNEFIIIKGNDKIVLSKEEAEKLAFNIESKVMVLKALNQY